MQRHFLALGLLAVSLAQPTQAVTVYGKGNVALQHADESGESELQLVSNASRIGVMGSEEISEGIEVIYQFEYGTEIDDGDSSGQTFTQRNIYLGLKTSAGTLMAGNFDTPTKKAQGKVDLFDNLEGDIKNIVTGDNRVKNIVQYVSPGSIGPFTAKVAYITEETDSDAGVSASLAYKQDALYLAAAIDQDVEDNKGATDLYRLVGAYTLGSVQLGALYESFDGETGDGDGYFGSVQWKLTDKWILKSQYGQSDIEKEGRETLSVGGDYKLSKSTKAFVYATHNEDDNGRDDDYVGVGMEMKF
ncbi:porin [Gilvimarinus agarilyticus]|uniref:porin n=1 Tax=unclassified Gilvimarinus TaxID=2642066 RepID=UPI001C09CFE6|nr:MULTISPECIES: porin [unclassified Gilvimarinus]MBU2885953.1 porin [Gilvimarinus agarilyticus]MDO6570699.1 porin [Gilvimarinus sp. 2_MG-2023]MDO6747708.1 porin [Gilvimarinus sp. 1_MG-2023]